MHRPIALLVLLIASTTAQLNSCTGDKNTTGYCETLSYIDRTTTSPNPTSSSECQDACRGVLSDAGDWSVDFRGPSHHPCPSLLTYQVYRPTRLVSPEHGRIAVWVQHRTGAGTAKGYLVLDA
jgi:hypothetical protein